MTGIDTNVLVRYITQDDPSQTVTAIAFMSSLTAESPGFISLVSSAELYWTLNHSYKTPKNRIIDAFETLLLSTELLFEEQELVQQALEVFAQSNADFDDCLIAKCSAGAGCSTVVTFDRKAAKSIGMTLLE